MVHNCGSSFSLWNHLMLMTVNFIIYYIYWALQGQGTVHISRVFWGIDKMNSIVIIRSVLANLNKLLLRNWSIKYIVFLSISVFTYALRIKILCHFFICPVGNSLLAINILLIVFTLKWIVTKNLRRNDWETFL